MNLRKMYLESAERWKQSSIYWRNQAKQILQRGDINHAIFCGRCATDCDRWASEDSETARNLAAREKGQQ